MSEKRFEFKLKVNFIDEETGEEIYHKVLIDNSNGNEIGFDDMVGLLNHLHQENKRKDIIIESINENLEKLMNESEMLKLLHKEQDKNNELKEENEQLKNRLNKEYIKEYSIK